MKGFAFAALAMLALAAPATAQDKPLTVEVLQTSAGSLYSNAALIMGERDAVLVDPPLVPLVISTRSPVVLWTR